MKKPYSTLVLTLICLVGLGVSVRAQDEHSVTVNVPFEFVAGGKTLPPGTYTVGRVSPESHPGLIISGRDGSTFLLPVVFDDASVKGVRFSFDHAGDMYFLSQVKTPAGVYTISLPRPVTKLAQMKEHESVSSAGVN